MSFSTIQFAPENYQWVIVAGATGPVAPPLVGIIGIIGDRKGRPCIK
jgi:hypothetical protein